MFKVHFLTCKQKFECVKQKLAQQHIIFFILVLFFLTVFFILFCIPRKENNEISPVSHGSIDVRGMTHFSIPLRGEWDYIPNEFCLYNWHDGQSAFLPGVWDGSRFGYASYHLKVEGLVPGVSYGLRVPYQATSFILYLDGKPAARNGKIGRTRDDSKPQYHSEVIYFNAHAGSVEVVLQVSNYFHRRGGPFQTILFGDSLSVRQTNYWLNFIDWAFVIVFLSMSIYQLSFWLIRRDRSILLMAAVLFFIGVNGIFDTSNALIFSLMPNLSWELYEKFCYFSSYATGMLLLLFLHEMYGGISSRLVKILIAPTFVIFLLVVC